MLDTKKCFGGGKKSLNKEDYFDLLEKCDPMSEEGKRLWEEYQKYRSEYQETHQYASIEDYIKYHNAIDRFVWTLRLRYAEKATIKSKRYRIDNLFQRYIYENRINKKRLYSLVGKENSEKDFTYFLKQGWYNELATTYPFAKNAFDIGTYFEPNKQSLETELFPSWYIIKSYYTAYSFYNALVFTNVNNLDTFKHRKPTNHFNNTLLKKFSNRLFFYPFNLSEPLLEEIEALRKVKRREWDFQYSRYPRNYNKTFYDIEIDLMSDFQNAKKKLNTNHRIAIIDLLYLFRIWANYIGNDTALVLRANSGLIHFLHINLYTINFFMAGFCEMMAISFLGEDNFIFEFNQFYQNFIMPRQELLDNWYNIALIIRLRIYEHLDILSTFPEDCFPPNRDKLKFEKL